MKCPKPKKEHQLRIGGQLWHIHTEHTRSAMSVKRMLTVWCPSRFWLLSSAKWVRLSNWMLFPRKSWNGGTGPWSCHIVKVTMLNDCNFKSMKLLQRIYLQADAQTISVQSTRTFHCERWFQLHRRSLTDAHINTSVQRKHLAGSICCSDDGRYQNHAS